MSEAEQCRQRVAQLQQQLLGYGQPTQQQFGAAVGSAPMANYSMPTSNYSIPPPTYSAATATYPAAIPQ